MNELENEDLKAELSHMRAQYSNGVLPQEGIDTIGSKINYKMKLMYSSDIDQYIVKNNSAYILANKTVRMDEDEDECIYATYQLTSKSNQIYNTHQRIRQLMNDIYHTESIDSGFEIINYLDQLPHDAQVLFSLGAKRFFTALNVRQIVYYSIQYGYILYENSRIYGKSFHILKANEQVGLFNIKIALDEAFEYDRAILRKKHLEKQLSRLVNQAKYECHRR